jgi:two-component system, OmpR family, sensor histidine kinase BaeS
MRWIGCLFGAPVILAIIAGAVVGFFFGTMGGFLSYLALAVALLLIAGPMISLGIRRMGRPMDRIIEAAGRIEAGDYSTHVPEWGPRELRSVARAFNEMAGRLKTIDEQRRSFLADVTHELRTPLTVIRGHAEAIADGVYPGDAAHLAPILDATQALDRLVDDLRTMVLSDAGNLVLHKEPTDIGALIHDTLESFRAQAESAGIALTGDLATNLPMLEVDPTRVKSALGNLLSNAIRHTPRGGSVKVVTTVKDGLVTTTVMDTGEGIPPDLVAHVFERFVKGPGSTGSGLGLAIAHDIVTAHGGTVGIESDPGSGTTVKMTLPSTPR